MRQQNYEQALTKEGVKWEYLDKVPIDAINITRGKQMQARLEPLDHDLIDTYASMLVDGFEPPPLLLWKQGRGLWIPLDGNQRLAANSQVAKKHQLKNFSAYVLLNEDPMIADRLCWTFNNLVNGRRLLYEDCLEHAISFCRKYNYTVDRSAKTWSVKSWELAARLREEDMIDLANRHKIKIPQAMPVAVILELHPLRTLGDDLCAKALQAAAETGMTQQDAKDLNKAIRSENTAAKKAEALEKFVAKESIQQRKAETQGGRGKAKLTPRERLQHQINLLWATLGNNNTNSVFKPVGHDDKEEFFGKALIVCNRLIEIYGLGQTLKGQGGQ